MDELLDSVARTVKVRRGARRTAPEAGALPALLSRFGRAFWTQHDTTFLESFCPGFGRFAGLALFLVRGHDEHSAGFQGGL